MSDFYQTFRHLTRQNISEKIQRRRETTRTLLDRARTRAYLNHQLKELLWCVVLYQVALVHSCGLPLTAHQRNLLRLRKQQQHPNNTSHHPDVPPLHLEGRHNRTRSSSGSGKGLASLSTHSSPTRSNSVSKIRSPKQSLNSPGSGGSSYQSNEELLKVLAEQNKSIENLLEESNVQLPIIRPQTHSYSRPDRKTGTGKLGKGIMPSLGEHTSSQNKQNYSRTARPSQTLLSAFPGLRQMLSALLERFVAAMRKKTTISELQEHLACMWSWLEQLHVMLKTHISSQPAQPDPSLSWDDLANMYSAQRWRPSPTDEYASKTARILAPLCPGIPVHWLLRPPVAFVRDIVRHVHIVTSMFDGVFRPMALLNEGFQDFEDDLQRVLFCEQLIAFVNDQTVHPVDVTAEDMVNGQKAEQTNELLQEVGLLAMFIFCEAWFLRKKQQDEYDDLRSAAPSPAPPKKRKKNRLSQDQLALAETKKLLEEERRKLEEANRRLEHEQAERAKEREKEAKSKSLKNAEAAAKAQLQRERDEKKRAEELSKQRAKARREKKKAAVASKNNWSSDEEPVKVPKSRKNSDKPPKATKGKGKRSSRPKEKEKVAEPVEPALEPLTARHEEPPDEMNDNSISSAVSSDSEMGTRRGSLAGGMEGLTAKQQRKAERAARRRRKAERLAVAEATKHEEELAAQRAVELRASEIRRRRAQTGILVVRLLKASALPRKKGTKHFFTLTLSFHSRNLPQTTFTSRTFVYERNPTFDQEFTFVVNNASVQRIMVSLDDNFKAWTQKSLDQVEIAIRDIRQSDLGVLHKSFAFEKGPGAVEMELKLTPTDDAKHEPNSARKHLSQPNTARSLINTPRDHKTSTLPSTSTKTTIKKKSGSPKIPKNR